MRRIRYSVAMSLDGYIAGPEGEFDWIVQDPTIDFAAFMKQFDTVLLGRKTFELTQQMGPDGGMPGMRPIVFSRTLRPEDHPKVTVLAEVRDETLASLTAEPGKDIWLMGGGELFRSLLDAGWVDTVEVGIIPILLGRGIPLLPSGEGPAKLRLTETKTLDSGIVNLCYTIDKSPPPQSLS